MFSCGFLSYSQSFVLDGNGVTVKCTSCAAGDTGQIGGSGPTYTAHDNTSLAAKSKSDTDWNLVVTTLVTNMAELFLNQRTFDQDISSWDTSNVTQMYNIFKGASAFNCDTSSPSKNLNNWDTSKVGNMGGVFFGALSFNKILTGWDTSSVTSFQNMFENAQSFNQNIGGWDTAKVVNMIAMFQGAVVFNQSLSAWDTSKVTRLDRTFRNARNFNNGASSGVSTTLSWDVSKVEKMEETFFNAEKFNAYLGRWDFSSVENMIGMFKETIVFNNGASSGVSTTLNWDTSSVTNMREMFQNADAFNGNLSNWVTSAVTNIQFMFFGANVFNNGASSAVSTTLNWNTSSVTTMESTFNTAPLFNGNLSNWNTSNVTRMDNMFDNAEVFNNGSSSGVSPTLSWNVSKVENMNNMFANANRFNQNISSWNTVSTTMMIGMFSSADLFNIDIGGWNVSLVTRMKDMFKNALAFKQDLTCWDVNPAPTNYSNFSTNSPINGVPLFLPRWGDTNTPFINYTASTAQQDDGLITPEITRKRGTFTASITGRLVHRTNQYGAGKADYLNINATTGVIDTSNSLAGTYDIIYTTCNSSFTTSITIRTVNNPGYQLSYSPNPICRSVGGTITPTIIPTNPHRTVSTVYLDPGNPVSYPNLGNAPDNEQIINLTTNSSFTHWEYGPKNDIIIFHPDYRIRNSSNGIVHNPGYSWELLPGANNDNLIQNNQGIRDDRKSWPISNSSISIWLKESDWSDDTMIYDFTSGGNTSGKDFLESEGGVWKRRISDNTYVLGNNTLTNNQWHHIVLTRDIAGGPGAGSNIGIIKFYVDGVLTSTVTGTNNTVLPSPGDVFFGRDQRAQNTALSSSMFKGEFGPIRIFQQDLTQSEVEYEYDMFALRYKGSFSATPAGLSFIGTTGIIDVSASVSGTYVVSATWTEPTSGKTHTATSTVTIGDSDASFSYPLNTYCQNNVSVITPTITGDTGGVFSAIPASGLSLNSSTGGITPSASTAGTYTVSYTTAGTCTRTTSFSITITAKDNPALSYTSNNSCIDVDASVSFSPTLSIAGGSFSVSPPSGLSIDSSGVIRPSASSVNLYTIEYTTAGTCTGSVSVTFEIFPASDPAFSYSSNNFCQSTVSVITPTITQGGGVFSGPIGLILNTSTGGITPSTSTAGTYTVSYTTTGPCPQTSSTAITITASDSPTLSYSSYSSCINVDSSVSFSPTFSPAGGSFSVSPPSGLIIDSSGVISPSTSSVGSYTIAYTLPGVCSETVSVSFEILPADDPTFSFSESSYCSNLPNSITPTITGTPGGVFSASPDGLLFDSTTGVISPSGSNPGTYTITYTTLGIIQDGLVLYLDTGNPNSYSGSGNTWYDLSGNDNDLTLNGNPSYNAGINGGVIDFDEKDDYAETNSNSVLNRTSYTKIAMFYPRSSTRNIISGSMGSARHAFWMAGTDDSVRVGHNSNWSNVSYSPGVMLNNWHYSAVTFSNTDGLDLYYNGTSVASKPSATTMSIGNGMIRVGAFSSGGGDTPGNFFDGYIPVVLIYDRVLNAEEIRVNYNYFARRYGLNPLGLFCGDSSSFEITINLGESSSFYYPENIYCKGTLGTVTPTIETSGGTFTSSPTGLNINSSTGEINTSLSSVATYTIEYTISGICSETSEFILVINDFKEDPNFSYPATSYCVSDMSTVTPTIETPGGTFSISPPSGLNINLTTGIINPSLSSVGSYTIQYTTAGNCQDTSSSTIEIKPEDNPSFSYGSNLFCTENISTVSPTIVTLGGTFTSSPTAGLSIDRITGFITPSTSDPGIYNITYTTPSAKNLAAPLPQIDNIVGHYPFDGSYEDLSGKNHHGEVLPTTDEPVLTVDRFGNPSSAYQFNGNTVLYFGDAQALEFPDDKDSFSISIWVKYDDSSLKDFISIGNYGCKNDIRGSIIRLGGNNESEFTGCSRQAQIVGDLSVDKWQHLVYVYDKNVGRKVFLDGVKQTLTKPKEYKKMFNIQNHGLSIGGGGYRNLGLNASFFEGQADDLKLWNSALTDKEVQDLYTVEDTAPLITPSPAVTLGCVSSTTISITISSLNSGTFDYGYTPGTEFCANDSDLTPSIGGSVSGTFYSLPNDGLDINLTTGKIDFQSSTPGTYSIFYEVQSLCGSSTTSSTIILKECQLIPPYTCDTDGDGVCCESEIMVGSDCSNPCSYFFPDVRFNTITSDWNFLDCDGDGVINGDELIDNTDPRNACSYKSESISGPVTSIGVDCDGDGVIGRTEVEFDKTDPLNSCSFNINSITLAVTSSEDCDGDGVINSKEATDNTDPFNGCSLNISSVSRSNSLAWQALDCDGDGVLNGNEINDGTDVYDRCDYNYYSITIFPERGFDCDGDGISNYEEVVNSKTNPKDPCDFDLEFIDGPFSDQWRSLDCDVDSYINSVDEFPLNRLEWFDTDNDSVGNNQDLDDDNDGIEDTKEGSGDIDNDGIPNSQDKDSDGDGCFDASEAGYLDLDLDGIIGSGIPEIDSNGKVSSSIGYVEIADNDINGVLDFLDAGSLIFEIIKEPNNTTKIIRGSEIEISILINSANKIAYKWQVNKSLDTSSPNTGKWIEITDDTMYGGTKTNKLIISNPTFDMEGWGFRAIANSPSYLCQEEIISQPSELIITNLNIPTAFSPDGDGINDTWTIRGGLIENYPNNKIYIFNRWGVSVYESKGYQNDWSGSDNSNSSGSSSSNLPVGTYFYVLDLNGDGSNVKKGYVYLTRMNNE